MREPFVIKTCGYAVSSLSVVLLGITSWKTASQNPMLLFCLLAGMATSLAGMFMRWLSYRMEKGE